MKLHQDIPSGLNSITGYGEGYVMVNGQRYGCSLIVMPEMLMETWQVPGFDALAKSHFEPLLDAHPEILLLGTGETQRFPHPKIFQGLYDAGIGVEVMDSAAACRTYNILMGEGRRVAAALILGLQAP